MDLLRRLEQKTSAPTSERRWGLPGPQELWFLRPVTRCQNKERETRAEEEARRSRFPQIRAALRPVEAEGRTDCRGGGPDSVWAAAETQVGGQAPGPLGPGEAVETTRTPRLEEQLVLWDENQLSLKLRGRRVELSLVICIRVVPEPPGDIKKTMSVQAPWLEWTSIWI